MCLLMVPPAPALMVMLLRCPTPSPLFRTRRQVLFVWGGELSQQLVTTTSLLPFPFLHATATSTAYGVTVLNADKAGSTAVT